MEPPGGSSISNGWDSTDRLEDDMSDDNTARFLWDEDDIEITKQGRVEDPYVPAGLVREGVVQPFSQRESDETEVPG